MEEELDEDDFELVTSDGPSEPFIVEQGQTLSSPRGSSHPRLA